jgi:signal peptidase II
MLRLPLKNGVFILLCTALFLVMDQGSKLWASSSLSASPWQPFSWFSLTYAENPGIAFSLPFGGPWLLVFSLLMIVGFTTYSVLGLDLRRASVKIAVILILGGALGNTIDRWRFGIVRDFIDIGAWPVFNLADIGIVMGLLLLIPTVYSSPHGRTHS